VRSADTSPEAHAVHVAVYRSMSPERRLAIGVQMSEDAFALMAAGIQRRHPDYDETDVAWALRRMRLGDEAFSEVWPAAPLLAP
jgi:hypothetical protein